jgi:hypothetical protein
MPTRPSNSASDYLHTASSASLESYELSRLNHAANLRREIAALIDQWIDETVQARLARCILEERAAKRSTLRREPLAPQHQLPFEASAQPASATLHLAPPLKLSRRNSKKPAA